MKHSYMLPLLLIGSYLNGQSIQDLDFLVGQWQVEETIIDGPKRGQVILAERTCAYTLDNNYIQCFSQEKDGVSYIFMFNYDEKAQSFNRTGFFSHRSAIARDQMYLEDQVLHLISNQEGRRNFHRSQISFADSTKLVWEGWTSDYQSDKKWELAFREVAVRVE